MASNSSTNLELVAAILDVVKRSDDWPCFQVLFQDFVSMSGIGYCALAMLSKKVGTFCVTNVGEMVTAWQFVVLFWTLPAHWMHHSLRAH